MASDLYAGRMDVKAPAGRKAPATVNDDSDRRRAASENGLAVLLGFAVLGSGAAGCDDGGSAHSVVK